MKKEMLLLTLGYVLLVFSISWGFEGGPLPKYFIPIAMSCCYVFTMLILIFSDRKRKKRKK